MRDYVPVEGHSGFYRNKNTGVIVNINKGKGQQARELKELKQKEKQEQAQMKDDIASLKDDIAGIRQMLTELLNKNG